MKWMAVLQATEQFRLCPEAMKFFKGNQKRRKKKKSKRGLITSLWTAKMCMSAMFIHVICLLDELCARERCGGRHFTEIAREIYRESGIKCYLKVTVSLFKKHSQMRHWKRVAPPKRNKMELSHSSFVFFSFASSLARETRSAFQCLQTGSPLPLSVFMKTQVSKRLQGVYIWCAPPVYLPPLAPCPSTHGSTEVILPPPPPPVTIAPAD